jgi:hypothetical protein
MEIFSDMRSKKNVGHEQSKNIFSASNHLPPPSDLQHTNKKE